jgi:ribosomal protein L24E
MSFWQILGRIAVSSEGQTIQRISDTTSVSSDGTTYTRMGSTTVGSDGSTFTQMGSLTSRMIGQTQRPINLAWVMTIGKHLKD